jgi:hypothetical protein
VKFAEDHLADLEPKLSRVTLVVPHDADMPGLEITLDGTPIGLAARGVPAPVDPGRHVVEAKAPGKQPFSQTLEIGAVADKQTVTIPTLVDLPTAVAPAQIPPAKAASPIPVAQQLPSDRGIERPTPTVVYVLGATTLALGVSAVVTGVVYLNERSSYKSSPSSPGADDHYDSARALGIANAGLWVATVGGAGVTAYLYFTRPERRADEHARAVVAPWISPDSAGLTARGAF